MLKILIILVVFSERNSLHISTFRLTSTVVKFRIRIPCSWDHSSIRSIYRTTRMRYVITAEADEEPLAQAFVILFLP